MMTQTYTSLVEFPNLVLKISKKYFVIDLRVFGEKSNRQLYIEHRTTFY